MIMSNSFIENNKEFLVKRHCEYVKNLTEIGQLLSDKICTSNFIGTVEQSDIKRYLLSNVCMTMKI